MNRLCFGTFAKALQDAIQKPNNNQAVAELLLGLVVAWKQKEPFTMSPKKVSELFNFKDDVPEEISAPASTKKIIDAMPGRIKEKLIPTLNPTQIEDVKENLRKVIKNDESIAPIKRNELLFLADKENDHLADFLSAVFLYAIVRSNKGQIENKPVSLPLFDIHKIKATIEDIRRQHQNTLNDLENLQLIISQYEDYASASEQLANKLPKDTLAHGACLFIHPNVLLLHSQYHFNDEFTNNAVQQYFGRLKRIMEMFDKAQLMDRESYENLPRTHVSEKPKYHWLDGVEPLYTARDNLRNALAKLEELEVYNSGLINEASKMPFSTNKKTWFDIIRKNSKAFFDEYKRINGIFIEPDIIPQTETKTGNSLRLNELLKGSSTDSIFLLYGDGGIGKSFIFFDCFAELIVSDKFLPLYIPMRDLIRTDESPILQYSFDNFFSQLDWKRDINTLKQSLRDFIITNDTQLIFFLDGLNEYTFAAKEIENNIVLDEIRWLQNINNVKVVVSSRSNKGFETVSSLRVKRLDEQCVFNYLQAQENTSSIDFTALKSKRIIELLQTPLMLALFTKTYSPVYTELHNISIESVQKHSDILMLCVEYQKNRLRKTSKANYALDILLPLITLDTDMKMNMDILDLAEQAKQKLQKTLSDDYKRLWFTKRNEYNRNDFTALISDEYTLYNDLIHDTILENSVFLVEHNDTISWQHELLMDWFAARGIVLTLEYQHEYAIKKLAEISDYITKFDAKTDGLLPVALFLVEMLENKPIAQTTEFVLLLSSLARSYHDAKDSKNIYKFAIVALEKMDKDICRIIRVGDLLI